MKRRKIIAAIVLLGGAALFFVIINASSSSNAPLVTAKAGGGTDGSLDYTASAGRGVVSSGSNGNGRSGGGATDNLTDILTQNYAQTVLQMNNGFAGATPDATNTISFPSVDTMASTIAGSLNQNLPYQSFTAKDISVATDNSTSSQLAYIEAFSALSAKNFSGFKASLSDAIDQFVSDNDPTLLLQYVAIIRSEVSGLLPLTVPSQMAAWHLENLNLWEKKLSAYTAILNMQNDPLKAYIALNEIDGLVGETQTLQNTINNQVGLLTTSK